MFQSIKHAVNAMVRMHGGSESRFVFIGFRRVLKHTTAAFRMIKCRYSVISRLMLLHAVPTLQAVIIGVLKLQSMLIFHFLILRPMQNLSRLVYENGKFDSILLAYVTNVQN